MTLHCEFDAKDSCIRCLRETRFPQSLRFCCGSPGCVASEKLLSDAEKTGLSAGLQIDYGPGTELHLILGRFGLFASGDCKCNSRAAYMDAQGCDWCEANIDEIVGWLRESAAERGLPFLDWPARLLIRRAIANARRKDAARAERSSHHDRREEVAPPSDAPQG